MEYTLHQNLENYEGVVSNLHGFLHRYLDTGFKSKWSGFWVPPYKFLDYYAIKVNGLWLDPGTLQGVEYGDSQMVFHHETDSLKIREKVETPDSVPGFTVALEIENMTHEKKALHVVLEPGVDIRHRTDDLGPEEYGLETGKDRLTISQSDKKLMIAARDFELKGDSYTKIHEPGTEQRCFVPGEMVFRREVDSSEAEEVEIEFSTDSGSFRSIEKKENQFEHRLGRTFEYSIDSVLNLVYDRNGIGIIAGHPWFQNYWARDTFWTLLGLIDAGYFQLSKEVLENFAESDLPGKIHLDGSEPEFAREDTYPLFVIAADKLARHYDVSEEIEEAMEDAMNHLELDDNIVDHEPEGSWMDTLERGKAVDLQSLWLEAAEIMDDERKSKLEKGLEEFVKNGMIEDELEGGAETINPAVPLMFGHIEEKVAENQLEKINGEFSSRFGARTRAVSDPGYESSGYHTGSSWGLTTGWAAAANFRYGKEKQGVNFLENMQNLLDRDQPGSLPEVVDSESGEILGCPEQAWSAGLFIHAIDTYLLGIRVEEDHVKVEPQEDVSCFRKGKKVRGEEIDLKFVDGEVEVLNDPDIDIRL